jgi:hypothetical protein
VPPRTTAIFPFEGNVHEFVAVPQCAAVLDVLLPRMMKITIASVPFTYLKLAPSTRFLLAIEPMMEDLLTLIPTISVNQECGYDSPPSQMIFTASVVLMEIWVSLMIRNHHHTMVFTTAYTTIILVQVAD